MIKMVTNCIIDIFLPVNTYMFLRFCTILFLICFINTNLFAQLPCDSVGILGQTPSTAFPVCGSSVFTQTQVPACVNNFILTRCIADGNTYQDLNPFWYKFTCFQSGTLGFVIAPKQQTDDYDWQLFDVTGQDPNVVYTESTELDSIILVSYNWSGNTGPTGTNNSADSLYECGSSYINPNPPIFSKMPNLIAGHNYLLMISHFSGSNQSGYSLSFGGGTASITDTTPPRLQSVSPNCDGSKLTLLLNKKMKCSSLARDGSDFILSPAVATITSVTSSNCSSGFDMDSIVITLSGAIPGGTYTLSAKNGSDGNTLIDNCDNGVPVGDSVVFKVLLNQPTPFDSLAPVGCAPSTLKLVFIKNIVCSSIAANGSDFVVTGTNPVTVTGASGNCSNGLTNIITVQLSAPIKLAGNYQLTLAKGTDGNTIIDECGRETAAGASIAFTTSDTVSAAFTSQVLLGCKQDTIVVANSGNGGINTWSWLVDDSVVYASQSVMAIYKENYGIKTALLKVSNGVCTDTSTQSFTLNNKLKAQFSSPVLLCPEDAAIFKDSSIGNIETWYWYFGNGNTSNSQVPPSEMYPPAATTDGRYYPIELVVHDANCYDTSYHEMKVLNSCYIAVATAFTPNGDGKNDYLYPLNAYKAVNLEFRVFNRWGQQVFETRDWTRKWDGTINGNPQSSGVYVWMLSYTNIDTGQKFSQKGTTVLVR